MDELRRLLVILGVAGAVGFGAALAASYVHPGAVESVAREVIRAEVEKKARAKVAALDDGFLAGHARRLAREREYEAATWRRNLADGLPRRVAAVVAEMRKLDCECRRMVEAGHRFGIEGRIGAAEQAGERINAFIRTKYMETAAHLTREFRIFTGTNAVVFALLAIAVIVKARAGLHLVPAAILLLVAAGATAYLYLFNQDWLHTIVFAEYVGFGYVAYLGVAFAVISDVLFNHGLVTTAILNAVFGALHVTLSAVPC